jgi:hygromycin-B 7''-O-kinase
MKEYSKRLGRISPEQFQAALEKLDLGNFIRAEPVPFGLFGQNVFVISTEGEFVLRGAPHYPRQFPTERFFVEQLHDKTHVPVPYPYLIESSTDIFGWSFVIMPRLPGLPLANQKIVSQLAPEDRLEIARAMARTLAEVHTLTWGHAGEYDPETNGVRPFDQDYGEWVVKRIREKVASARRHNDHTTDSDVLWVESIIANAADAIHTPSESCVVLGDYGEHNAAVEHTPDGWRVSGVFDLMTAHFGDGKADLAMQAAGYPKGNLALADEFVQEYLRHRPAQSGFVERQQLYTLGLYTSMWEYWQRDRDGPPEDKTVCFEQWAKPFVEYWGGIIERIEQSRRYTREPQHDQCLRHRTTHCRNL